MKYEVAEKAGLSVNTVVTGGSFYNTHTIKGIDLVEFDKINATPLSFDPLQDSIIYMLEHFNEPVTVENLARQAGYHPKYFIKIF